MSDTPQSEFAMFTNFQLVQAFIGTRTHCETEEGRLEEVLKPHKTLMKAIEAEMLRRSIAEKTNSFATEAGTCYKSTIKTAKMKDPDGFFNWAYAQGIDTMKAMLSTALAKDAVYEYVDTHKTLVDGKEVPAIPPGIELGGVTKMNFKAK